ncbi:hypothetical protein [Streptomyces sp. NPDC046261]|uniref:hypothetical protein n=1 Tax=Streptomyces sp. NPDC046261 TaxID=3157200 RepID=UPI00340F61A7
MSSEGSTAGGGADKRRRRHSPLAVASVAAAVLLAGGGGAYWASTASDGDGGGPVGAPGDGGSPAPLELDGYGRSAGPAGSSQGIAVGEPDPRGTRYRAEGKLPAGPRTAAVHLPEREVSRERVAALAKALDVQGSPRLAQGTWTVGGGPDAAGPTLQVSERGPGNWSYSRYGVPGGTHCVPKGPGTEPGPKGEPGPKCPTFRDGSPAPDPAAARPVPEEKARSVAAPVFKALGQDDAKADARKVSGALRVVTVDPVVDSLPTYGWRTSLQIGSDAQVVGGSGQLDVPKKGATYPLITAERALEELNKGAGTGRVSVGGCATAVPFKDDGGTPCPGKPEGPEPVAVTGAVLGLSAQSVSGRQALVPSWLFTARMPGEKDGTVTVAQPAIDPRFIAKPSSPPAGDGPGGKPTATPPSSGPVQVESYTVSGDGRKLVLHFWGGVCSDYAASAEQSSSAVTVKVTGTEKQPGRYCVMMIKRFDTEVTLDEPLGERRVVDLASGNTVRERQEK